MATLGLPTWQCRSTSFGNLWLNRGHGTLGWTMSCGSGRVLADLMSGVVPEIATGDLSLDRYAASLAPSLRTLQQASGQEAAHG